MIDVTNRKKLLGGLVASNVIFLCFTWLFNNAEQINDLPKLMYSTGDSLSYLATANWLFNYHDSTGLYGGITIRPFLYPLLIGITRGFFGEKYHFALYICQLLMFLFAANLIFFAIWSLTRSEFLPVLGFLFLLFSFSLMGLTRHALTEITGLLFITIFIFWASLVKKNNWTYFALFAIALATVVRPIYQTMMYIWLIYVFFIEIQKSRIGIFFLKTFICLSPVFIQYYLVYLDTGRFFFSEISIFTFKNWFMSQLYFKVEWQTTWTFEQATQEVSKMSTFDMVTYIFNHLRDAQYVYRTNILQEGLLYGAEYGPSAWRDLSVKIHAAFAVLHGIMLPVLLFYIVKAIKKRFIPPIFVIYVFFMIHVLSTGISAWQGDRLIVTAAPLWITVYLWVISQWIRKIRPQAAY